MKIAITGHTLGLGKSFFDECLERGHIVSGFSRFNGYDLRDYNKVGDMLSKINDYDLFINNAKPDYAQAQILYRLIKTWNTGIILSIGSSVILNPPNWSDLNLLEYVTQKHALAHANETLKKHTKCNLILVNPEHLGHNTKNYVIETLNAINI
jgi:hypothetical protein